MNQPSTLTAVLLATIASCLSCGGPAPPKIPRETHVDETRGATFGRVVEARCDREDHCNNVGAGKPFQTSAECAVRMQAATENDLNLDSCPARIDQAKLGACLSAIGAETCDTTLDALGRLPACATGTLCAR